MNESEAEKPFRRSGLSFEQEERERQRALRLVRKMHINNLRIARAVLVDFLAERPPEPAASIIQLRGEIAHLEIQRRDAGIGMWERFCLGVITDPGGSLGELEVRMYTTIIGWNDSSKRGG